jgi:hypothetical protein
MLSTLAAVMKLLSLHKHTSAGSSIPPSKSTLSQIAFPVLKLDIPGRRRADLFQGDALAEAAQNNHAADAKTGDRSQSQRFGELRTEMHQVA